MSGDKEPEKFQLQYVDAYDCRASVCTGVVLSGPGDGGLFQLLTYADAQRISPEILERMDFAEDYATYARKNAVRSEPYREVQTRILLTGKTLLALRDLIDRTLSRTQELAEKADVPSE